MPRRPRTASDPARPAPPSLREIADAAGVSVATVSMALRNHPRVSAETRERLKRLAKSMGYAQNPEIARLMHHLRRGRAGWRAEPLAWVSPIPRASLVEHSCFGLMFRGATARALELGHRLDYHTTDETMTPARLGRVLRNRGVRGVVIGPQLEPEGRLDLGWDHFASVAIGYSVSWPETSRVLNDQMQSVHLAMAELKRLGYRRPALVLEQWMDDRLRNRWTGAFLSAQLRHCPPDAHIPPMMHPADRKGMRAWFKRWRPDVLLGADLVETLGFLAEDLGIRVPQDCAFAVLDKQPEGRWAHHAGIDQASARLGQAAVDLLAACLMRNEIGPPACPQIVSLPGVWVDGVTAPPRAA